MVQMAVSASAAATIVGVLLVIQLTAATRPISESTEATTLLRAPGRRSLLQTSAPAEAQGPLESIVTEPDGSPKAISAVISVVTTVSPRPADMTETSCTHTDRLTLVFAKLSIFSL